MQNTRSKYEEEVVILTLTKEFGEALANQVEEDESVLIQEESGFEGSGDALQFYIPLAYISYLTLSRVLTFVERLVANSSEANIRGALHRKSEGVEKEIKIDELERTLREIEKLGSVDDD